MGLIIVISNLRLMLDNFKKYGILVTISGSKVSNGDWRWFWILYALTPCHLFVAYLIELAASRYAVALVSKSKKEERGQGDKVKEGEQKSKEEDFAPTSKSAVVPPPPKGKGGPPSTTSGPPSAAMKSTEPISADGADVASTQGTVPGGEEKDG